MSDSFPATLQSERRTLLVRVIVGFQLTMGAMLAVVLGRAAIGPSFAARRTTWLRAAQLDAVREGEPLPVTIRVARQDGYTQVVDRKAIYLVREGNAVRAFSSTCTHLGCRTSYDKSLQRIVCPCHGGVYDLQGNVLAGPPPAPLPTLAARVDNGAVLVQV